MFIYFSVGGALGDCTTDQFVMTSSGNKGTPVICGFNTGQHSQSFQRVQFFKGCLWLRGRGGGEKGEPGIILVFVKIQSLRFGEN
jgi:hypothetical protein